MPSSREEANLGGKSVDGELVLAVDTGGSKTAAWLVDSVEGAEPRALGQARTTAGNPLSVGFEQATQAIADAIALAKREAQVDDQEIARAILSIAGAANREMAKRFVDWARAVGLAKQVAVVSDVLPILAGGTPDCCGVALISGTGSSAFGRAADGRSKRCGGWGFLLGDEGSGFAIGRAALQHTLRTLEAQAPAKGVVEAIRSELQVNSVTELTRTVYGNPNPRHAIADLSKLVAAAAEQGDPEAARILDRAALDLAQLAARTAHAVGVANVGFPLALSGGVLINSVRLQQQLHSELSILNLKCAVTVVREPLVGCVRLASPRFADVLVNWHAA